jgi:hypothetical protein
LRKSLGTANPGTTISSDEILRAIIKSRRATRYDAINYLIPDYRQLAGGSDATPTMVRESSDLDPKFAAKYRLFAPLVGPSTLYKTNDTILTTLNEYIGANKPAIETYLKALLGVANSIYNTKNDKGENLMITSAKSIHINTPSAGNLMPAPLNDADCKKDIASLFAHFFLRTEIACGIIPLSTMMLDYINKNSNPAANQRTNLFYISTFYKEESGSDFISPENISTAYFPGRRQGTKGDIMGTAGHPLDVGTETTSTRRNFYSTKFFQMSKISTSGKTAYQSNPALRESETEAPSELVGQVIIKNPINLESSGLTQSFFLDF